jgi:nucleotide-binding universal stress UspA family protein
MRLMLAYDDSAGARTARDLVANMDLPAGSTITLAMVLQPVSDVFGAPDFETSGTAEAAAMLIADLQEMLTSASAPFRPRFRLDQRILRGRPATALVAEAGSINPDLIVTGSRGHGPFASVLLGSVSTELVDHAPCPVLIARRPQLQRLVLGVDGSDAARHAVELMQAWPFLAALPVVVTSVAPNETAWTATVGPALVGEWPVAIEELNREALAVARRNAADAARQLADAGIAVTVDVRCGDPADQLIGAAEAHGADLIVIGSRGLGTWSRLVIGSVAHKVVQHARQSVLVTRMTPQPATAMVSEETVDPARNVMAQT